TRHTGAGLAADTTYYLRAQAYNSLGVTDYSWLALGSTVTLANEPLPLSVTQLFTSSMTAAWGANGNGAGIIYNAQVSTSPAFSVLATSSRTANIGAAFSGLSANTTYYLRVNALNRAGSPTAWTALGAALTLIEAPAGVYFDEVGTATIVASAYASALTGLDRGVSGVNVAAGGVYGAWTAGGNSWTTKAPMPTARRLVAAATVGGRLYAIGGHSSGVTVNTNEEYDPVSNTWTTKTPMPTTRYKISVGAINGKVYAVGGVDWNEWNDLKVNEEYDPVANTWAVKAAMPTARFSSAAGVIGGRLYIVGGGYSLNNSLAVNEVYDTASNTWSTKAPLPAVRRGLAAGVIGGKLYAVGGYAVGAVATNTEYDSVGDSWTVKAAMPMAKYDLAAGIIGGKLYAIGGDPGADSANAVYDPAADTWMARALMPTVRSELAAGVIGGKLYVVGGTSDGDAGLTMNEKYDPGVAASFTGLAPNTRYFFKAKARNAAGVETGESVTVSTYTLAAEPYSAGFSEVEYSSAAFNWQGGLNPAGTVYQYEVAASPVFGVITSSGETAGTALMLTGLAEGATYYGRVRAFNAEGLATAYAAAVPAVTRVNAPPVTAVLQPGDRSFLTALTQFSGLGADDIMLASVAVSLTRLSDNYSWDGSGWTAGRAWLDAELTGSSWTYTGVPAWVTDSSYTVSAKALDNFGLWSVNYSTSLFTYDITPPVSSVLLPETREVSTFTYIAGTAADAGGIAQVKVSVRRWSDENYWSGGGWTPSETWNLAAGTTAWFYTGISSAALLEGTTYLVMSQSYDLAGNISDPAANSSTFTYLGTPPTVEILRPGNDPAYNSLGEISGAAADDVSVSSVVLTIARFSDGYFWNGADWQAGQAWLDADVAAGAWSYASVPAWVNASSYTVTAKARDNNYHWSVEYSTSVFIYDTTAPVLSVTAPDNGALFNYTSTTAVINYSDEGEGGLGRASLVVKLDGLALEPGVLTLYVSSAAVRLSGLTQGVHTLDASIQDNAGNPADAVQTGFTVDLSTPAIGVVLPAGGAFLNYTSTMAVIAYSDAGGAGLNLASLAVKLDGAAVDLGAVSVYASSAAVQLSGLAQAAHTLNASIRDNAGNLADAVQAGFTVDLASPAVSIAQPAGGIFNYTSTTAVINYSDAGGSGLNAASLIIKLDSVALSTAAFTRYASSVTVPLSGLSQAVHTLDTSIQDNAGNLTIAVPGVFKVDLTSPTIVIARPDNGSFFNYTSTTVVINYADTGGLGLSTSTLAVKLDAVALSTAAFTYYASSATVQVTGLLPGVHALDASVQDKAGNLTSAAQSAFKVDLDSPTVAIAQPVSGSFQNYTSTLVVVNYADTGNSGLSTSTLVIKLDAVPLSTGAYTRYASSAAVQLTGLSETVHTLDASIQDKAGNLAAAVQTGFTVDLSSPAVTLIRPADGGFFNYTSTTVVVGYADAGGSGVSTATLIVMLDSVALSTGAYTRYASSAAVQLAGLAQSTHTLAAFMLDKAGNTGGAVQTGFTVDLTTPAVAILQPANGSVFNYTSTTAVVNFSDAGGAGLSLTSLVVELDGVTVATGAVIVYASSASVPLTGLAQSTHTLDAFIRDNAGNLASAVRAGFTVDFTIPPAAVADLAAGALTAGAVELSWTAPGDEGNTGALDNSTFTVQYSTFAGAAWSTAAAQVNISTTGVNPGTAQHYTLGGLSANTSYYFRLWTKDGQANYSALSNAAMAATLAEAPSSVVFSGVAYSSAALSWAGGANPAGTGYQYQLAVSSGFGAIAASGSGPAVPAWLTGLAEGTTYYGRVRALSVGGIFTAYAYTSGTAVTLVYPRPPDGTVAGISGSALGVSSISWTWNAGTIASAEQFSLYSASGVFVATIPFVSSAAYTRAGLEPNTAYRLLIAGTNWVGDGQLTASATVYTLAAAPDSPAAVLTGSAAIQVSWAANGNPAGTLYELWRSTTGSGYGLLASVTGTYINSGLNAATEYYYKVRAVNGNGIASAFSAAVSTRTPEAPLQGAPVINGAAAGTAALAWSWSAVGGAAGYRVLNSTFGSVSGDLAAGSLSWQETGLSTNTAYTRYVQAYNSVSAATSGVTPVYTLAAAPDYLGALRVDVTSAALGWGTNQNPAGTIFQLWRDTSAAFGAPEIYNVTADSYTAAGLAPSTT
ncbi:MAG: hypothetical protein NTY45_05640, partial [Elusimicrobia bacterium]|nr:hypothetical protein [Elusimicrobiota bacterium]